MKLICVNENNITRIKASKNNNGQIEYVYDKDGVKNFYFEAYLLPGKPYSGNHIKPINMVDADDNSLYKIRQKLIPLFLSMILSGDILIVEHNGVMCFYGNFTFDNRSNTLSIRPVKRMI